MGEQRLALAFAVKRSHTQNIPKRNSKPKRPKDINQLAHELVRQSTEEVDSTLEFVSRVMREMGRKGGKIGGKRRLETMTPEQRSDVALKAAKARWAKKSPREPKD